MYRTGYQSEVQVRHYDKQAREVLSSAQELLIFEERERVLVIKKLRSFSCGCGVCGTVVELGILWVRFKVFLASLDLKLRLKMKSSGVNVGVSH